MPGLIGASWPSPGGSELRDDMPKKGLPITCEHCGFSWNDGDRGVGVFGLTDVGNVELIGSQINCPRCRKSTPMPEGNLKVREGRWQLIRGLAEDLRSAEATADDYAKLVELLRQAESSGEAAGQVADEIAAQTPFARLAETIRAHPPGWIAYLLAAILTILLWRFPYHGGEAAPDIPTHPTRPPVVLQLTNSELDELAKQIDAQLERRQDLSQKIEISIPTQKGSQRNKPCTCGSGVKYKKCCGSAVQGQHS